MTISSTQTKEIYQGNGTSSHFAIPFMFINDEDIEVYLGDDETESKLTSSTDYQLSGAGAPHGGNCTLTTPPASHEVLVIRRKPAITQEVDYVENDAFPAATHEGALDKLTMICQSLSEKLDRSLSFKVSSAVADADLPTPKPNAALAWNERGDTIVNGPSALEIAKVEENAIKVDLAADRIDGYLEHFVKDFGAKGDFTQKSDYVNPDTMPDDTQPIMDAIRAAQANPNGGVVRFPAGTFRITAPLDITDSPKPITLMGEGPINTVIYGDFAGANTAIIDMGFSSNDKRIVGHKIQGMMLCSNGVPGDPIAIRCNRMQETTLHDVHVPGNGGFYCGYLREHANTGLYATQVNNADINLCQFKCGYHPPAYPQWPSGGIHACGLAGTNTLHLSNAPLVSLAQDPTFEQDGTAGGWSTYGTASTDIIKNGVCTLDSSVSLTWGGLALENSDFGQEGKKYLIEITVDSIDTGYLTTAFYNRNSDGTPEENTGDMITESGTYTFTLETDADSYMFGVGHVSEVTNAVISKLNVYPLGDDTIDFIPQEDLPQKIGLEKGLDSVTGVWDCELSALSGSTGTLSKTIPKTFINSAITIGEITGTISHESKTLTLSHDVSSLLVPGLMVNVPLAHFKADASARGLLCTEVVSVNGKTVTLKDAADLREEADGPSVLSTLENVPITFAPAVFIGTPACEDTVAEARQTNDCVMQQVQIESYQSAGLVANRVIALYLDNCKLHGEGVGFAHGKNMFRSGPCALLSEVKNMEIRSTPLSWGASLDKGQIWMMGSRGQLVVDGLESYGRLPNQSVVYLDDANAMSARVVMGNVWLTDGDSCHDADWRALRVPAFYHADPLSSVNPRGYDADHSQTPVMSAAAFNSFDSNGPNIDRYAVYTFRPETPIGMMMIMSSSNQSYGIVAYRTEERDSQGTPIRGPIMHTLFASSNFEARIGDLVAEDPDAVTHVDAADRIIVSVGTDGKIHIKNTWEWSSRLSCTILAAMA